MFQPELVSQGLMLNQPAVYPEDWSDPTDLLDQDESLGYNFWYFAEDPIYQILAGLDTTTLYQSEIARRPSVISQDWSDAGPSGTVAFQLWKQGIIRRGGPADIMARRFVMPATDEEEFTTETECEQRTTEEQCTDEQVCTTETTCVDNLPNPAYKPNPGHCKKTPVPLACYPYLDPDGNPTLDLQTCEDVTTCETVTTCEDVETCVEVETCDDLENCTCHEVQTCTGGVDDNLNPYGYANMECLNADGTSAWALHRRAEPPLREGSVRRAGDQPVGQHHPDGRDLHGCRSVPGRLPVQRLLR